MCFTFFCIFCSFHKFHGSDSGLGLASVGNIFFLLCVNIFVVFIFLFCCSWGECGRAWKTIWLFSNALLLLGDRRSWGWLCDCWCARGSRTEKEVAAVSGKLRKSKMLTHPHATHTNTHTHADTNADAQQTARRDVPQEKQHETRMWMWMRKRKEIK